MRIPETDIEIDNFAPPASAYFLTHYHSDHMRGLHDGWKRANIYCSSITAKLLAELKGLPATTLCTIDVGEEIEMTLDGKNISVRAFDANHCPGSLMLLFESNGTRTVHTGDFRFEDDMRRQATLFRDIDFLFLDSTYDQPHYSFPTQREAIEEVLSIIEENIEKEIFLAVYTIGKNRIVDAIYERFNRPVYLNEDKYRAYQVMGYTDEITSDKSLTNIKGYARGYFDTYFKMNRRRHLADPSGRTRPKQAVVIIPTGWAVDKAERDPDYSYVPYSEHCDYEELREFKALINAKTVIKI